VHTDHQADLRLPPALQDLEIGLIGTCFEWRRKLPDAAVQVIWDVKDGGTSSESDLSGSETDGLGSELDDDGAEALGLGSEADGLCSNTDGQAHVMEEQSSDTDWQVCAASLETHDTHGQACAASRQNNMDVEDNKEDGRAFEVNAAEDVTDFKDCDMHDKDCDTDGPTSYQGNDPAGQDEVDAGHVDNLRLEHLQQHSSESPQQHLVQRAGVTSACEAGPAEAHSGRPSWGGLLRGATRLRYLRVIGELDDGRFCMDLEGFQRDSPHGLSICELDVVKAPVPFELAVRDAHLLRFEGPDLTLLSNATSVRGLLEAVLAGRARQLEFTCNASLDMRWVRVGRCDERLTLCELKTVAQSARFAQYFRVEE
jgi:hypothetical protein